MAPRDRLSGAALKPSRAAAVKSRGGEPRVKSPGQDPGQVSGGKTSASKPSDDASLTQQVLSKPEVIMFSGTSPLGA
jgi:hypothetical protein